MDLAFRVVRDLFSPEVEEFVVDTREVFERCIGLRATLVPALVDRVRLYEGAVPLFESLGIEKDIEKALRRRVWLRSGGYIVIDQTEALVSIDVNTGKYVGKRDFEQTVLKINLESVGEIVRQIRLRDLGGIIIIDFIDMEQEEHREQVVPRPQARPGRRQGPHQRAADLGAGPGRDDPQARPPGSPLAPHHGLSRPARAAASPRPTPPWPPRSFARVRARAAADRTPASWWSVCTRTWPRYLEADARDALEKLAATLDRKITVQAVTGHAHRDEFEVLAALMAAAAPEQHRAHRRRPAGRGAQRGSGGLDGGHRRHEDPGLLAPLLGDVLAVFSRTRWRAWWTCLSIKQGERIARQKGWKLPKPVPRPAARSASKPSKTQRGAAPLPPRIRQPAESVLIDDPTWPPADADSLTGRRGASIVPRGGMANG